MSYPLVDLAQRWKEKTENDILRMAVDNELRACIQHKGAVTTAPKPGIVMCPLANFVGIIRPIDIVGLIVKGSVKTRTLIDFSGRLVHPVNAFGPYVELVETEKFNKKFASRLRSALDPNQIVERMRDEKGQGILSQKELDVLGAMTNTIIINRSDIFFLTDEINRVEAEHPELLGKQSESLHSVTTIQEEKHIESRETEVALVERLKLEGLEDMEIAHNLEKVFPQITPHRIGKLITEKPEDKMKKDAYRKRGKKLLKQYSEKNKK